MNGVRVVLAVGCDVVEGGQEGLGVVALQASSERRGVADAVVPADGHRGASQWHTGIAVSVERLSHTANL